MYLEGPIGGQHCCNVIQCHGNEKGPSGPLRNASEKKGHGHAGDYHVPLLHQHRSWPDKHCDSPHSLQVRTLVSKLLLKFWKLNSIHQLHLRETYRRDSCQGQTKSVRGKMARAFPGVLSKCSEQSFGGAESLLGMRLCSIQIPNCKMHLFSLKITVCRAANLFQDLRRL